MEIVRGRRTELVLFTFLIIFIISLGYYMLYPVSVTYDPSMHAEIVNIIEWQGYPDTWEPYANNSLTYTPFFHYVAFSLSLTGIHVIDAVRIVGIIAYILISISTYFLVSLYSKKNRAVPVISALVMSFIPLMGNIFLLGEFPEVLSILFIILILYSIKTERHTLTAIFTGLTVITHPFMAMVAVVLYIYNIKNVINEPNKTRVLYFLIFIVISSFWAVKYFEIANNMVTGSWQNTVYHEQQPYLWFWEPHQIIEFLFGFNQLGYFIFLFSLVGFWKFNDKLLRVFYIFCLIFIVFHLPYSQLKILDLFVVPIVIFAAVGIWTIINLFKGKYMILVASVIVFILAFSQVSHFTHVRVHWMTEYTLDEDLLDATLWLRDYNDSLVRIYSEEGSSWIGIISNKNPLEPYVTYLETFSDSYVEQLTDRDRIKDYINNSESAELEKILEKYDVKFVFTKDSITADYIKKAYYNTGWNLYEVIS
jgi:hypothetical protein